MDESRYGSKPDPFPLTLDPEVFYPSRQHVMAESVLEYAMESQAPFCLLSGDIGCGKSLLVSRLLSKLGDGVKVGLINHTHGRMQSIHGLVAFAFGIEHRPAEIYKTLVNWFQHEHAEGRRALLIVDEAQNLAVDTLEELRLLSNVNSGGNVLQILIVGQPELRERLRRPELLQFAQRISAQFHLVGLDCDETRAYIRHRLQVTGANPSLFTNEAMDLVYARTQGAPRLINQLCHFAMTQASSVGRASVDAYLMMQLPRDGCGGFALQPLPDADRQPNNREQIAVFPEPRRGVSRAALATAAGVSLAVVGTAWWGLYQPHDSLARPASAVVATGKDSDGSGSARALGPAPDSIRVAPEPHAPVATPAPAAAVAVKTAPVASVPPAPLSVVAAGRKVEAKLAPLDASSPRAVRPNWYLNRAIERLNDGDTAGAERLMLQASAAGAGSEDVADLRAGIDAQKLELQLASAGNQVRAAISANAVLDPAPDSAESRYREMLALSPIDPLTLRAKRELHSALMSNAQDAIQKDQFDVARSFLAADEKIAPSPDMATARDRLLGEIDRGVPRATTTASVPAAQAVNVTARDQAVTDGMAVPQGPSHE
jgi:type II secretory pathway predicted ATPase ExeA